MKKRLPENLLLYIVLSLSGGAMDAYSYLCRDRVFANAQTGNMLLLGVNLARGEFNMALKYFWPVLAFALGIALAEIFGERFCKNGTDRKVTVLAEALILLGVCFIPKGYSAPANALTSFACGMQAEVFRSVSGNTIATTMCIGNLRSGTHNLTRFFQTREKDCLLKAALYFGIIFAFVLGAIAEGELINLFDEKALLLSPVLLLGSFALLLFKIEK